MKPVKVALCEEHGLHGQRDDCHECGGPVRQVLMYERWHAALLALSGVGVGLMLGTHGSWNLVGIVVGWGALIAAWVLPSSWLRGPR